ncbi:hypothetical protein ACLMJK_008658 [Lecanora helva]
MSQINKVAIAGATGNIGAAIFDHLLKAGFQVTVLTRKESTHTFPSSVTVKPVDYDSLDSLTTALQGQDAFISALGAAALAHQLLLVEAASKAHVKRFIPSEFGCDTTNPKVRSLPVFADKVKVQEALDKEAAAGRMTYTAVCTGPFLDWGIKVGFVLNLAQRSINLYDGGDIPFSATSLPSIGKAVVGVLKHPEETADRPVFTQDAATTLKKLAAFGKKATGTDDWTETVMSTDDELKAAWAELQSPNPNPQVFAFKFISVAIWNKDYGSHFAKTDNELLGIKEMSDAELQTMVNGLV